jgi:hypothetical protein
MKVPQRNLQSTKEFLMPPQSTIGALGLLLFPCSLAFGQLSTVPAPAGFGQPSGAKFADYHVSARAEAGLAPTTNIKLDPSEESDIKRIISLSATADADWQRHDLAASVNFFSQNAADSAHDMQDNNAFSGSLNGRYELRANTILRAGLQRQQSIIGKDHVDQLNGLLHGTATSSMANYGAEWDNSRWFVSAMGQFVDVINDSNTQDAGNVIVQSLDRKESQLTIQSGRRVDWGNIYAFAGGQTVSYAASDTVQFARRDSEGWRIGGGAEFLVGSVRGAVSIIKFTQNFDTDSIPDLHATVGTAQFNYQISEKLLMSVLLQRNFSETNIAGVAGIFTSTYFAGVRYTPAATLYFKLGPAYNRSQLAGTSIATKRVSWEWASVWQFHDRAALSIGISHSRQGVNDTAMMSQQYDETGGTLSLVLSY